MKKTNILLVLTFFCAFVIGGCTQNQRAKGFGGTANQALPPNMKLVTATWKNDDLWVLTRPMHTNEVPEAYVFQEYSSFGIMQGTVNITESREPSPK